MTVISKKLGHVDMTMTLNAYSHLVTEDKNKAIDLINELNKKSRGSVERLQLPNSASSAINIILQN